MQVVSRAARWEPRVLLHAPIWRKPHACTLRGLFKGTLHVISECPIDEGTPLTVDFGNTTVAGTVEYCHSVKGRCLVSIAVAAPTATRRSDHRFYVDQTCSIKVLHDGCSSELTGVITDVSASGVGLRIRQPLDRGAMLCVQAGNFLASGHLLHCRRLDGGEFAAGVAVTDFFWGQAGSHENLKRPRFAWLERAWQILKRALEIRTGKGFA